MTKVICCTGHAHFFNQLSTGIDVVGVAGEWLTAMANTNMSVKHGVKLNFWHYIYAIVIFS